MHRLNSADADNDDANANDDARKWSLYCSLKQPQQKVRPKKNVMFPISQLTVKKCTDCIFFGTWKKKKKKKKYVTDPGRSLFIYTFVT